MSVDPVGGSGGPGPPVAPPGGFVPGQPAQPGGFVPGPPAGPGVTPPFAAPPTDRSRRRLWIGLGIGGLVLLLCVAGGLVGIGALVATGIDETKRQARAAVTDYLTAVGDRDYRAAHALLCESFAQRFTVEELAAEARRQPFTDFRLDEPRVGYSVDVTAHLVTSGGEVDRVFVLDAATQPLRICAIR